MFIALSLGPLSKTGNEPGDEAGHYNSSLTLLVVITNVSFGGASSSQPTHLDDVQCIGTEPNMLNCSYNGIGVHNCGNNHKEDVGIICERSQGIVIIYFCDIAVMWLSC